MKSTIKIAIKIAVLSIAVIYFLSILGWAIAIDKLDQWCDRYVAESTLKTEPKPQAIAVIRTKGKAIAPKAISITIKESRPDYAAMNIRELKTLCKGTGIKGWEKLCKAKLVDALYAI